VDGQLPVTAQQIRYDHRKLERFQLPVIHRLGLEKIQNEKV